MATINLLPWREERREELKNEFIAITIAFALAAAAVVFIWQLILNSQIDYQASRNNYLKKNIGELEEQVQEIAELKQKKNELVERMEVIQSLQGNRPEIVHIFDELVRTLPDGVFYNFIERKGNQIGIKGTAESNNRVSSLMRQLEDSEWFSEPNLRSVKANAEFGEQANDFEMVVILTSPNTVEEEAETSTRGRKPGARR